MIQRKNSLRNLKDFYSAIRIPSWKTLFSLCLGESCSANIRTFKVPLWIPFARFHWLKPHCVSSKHFQTKIGCILSSGNGAFGLESLPTLENLAAWNLFIPWSLTELNVILLILLVLVIFFFLKLIFFSYKYFKKRLGEINPLLSSLIRSQP